MLTLEFCNNFSVSIPTYHGFSVDLNPLVIE